MHRITKLVPDLRDRCGATEGLLAACRAEEKKRTIRFRRPVPEDAEEMERICKATGVLEVNSRYSFLMMIKYFGHLSCIIAEDLLPNGKASVIGYLMGFPHLPGSMNTGFVWQYGVDKAYRGLSLGPRLLVLFAEGLARHGVEFIEATIVQNNEPSKRAWQRFSRDLGAPCAASVDPAFAPRYFATREEGEQLLSALARMGVCSR